MMTIKKLTMAATSLVGLVAISTAGELAVVAARGAQDPKPAVSAAVEQNKKPDDAAKVDEQGEVDALV
jgi:hypothetical protein